MAEGRMLKRNISDSRRLAALKTDSARLLWTWIIPFLDCEGRFFASPDMIKGKVVPRITTFTDKNIPKYIEEMAAVGLITLYQTDGELLLQYRKFDAFQKIKKDREAPPLPGPTTQDEVQTYSGLDQDQIPRESRLPVCKLKEVKLKESKGTPDLVPDLPVDNSLTEPEPIDTPPEKTLLKKEEENPPSKNTHGERWTEQQRDDLEKLTQDIQDRYGYKYHQQVHVWVQTYFNRGNPEAIIYCLRRLIQERLAGKSIPAPGRWLEVVIAVENAKYEARESEREHKERKAEETRDVARLINGIGRRM